MKEKIIKIDVDGYYLRDLIVTEGEEYPKYYTNVQLPTNEEGEQSPFYRAKWNGTEWVEDMSQEEIEAIQNTQLQPTIEEQLAEKDAQILKLKEEQFMTQKMTTQNAETQQELIELLMDMGVI